MRLGEGVARSSQTPTEVLQRRWIWPKGLPIRTCTLECSRHFFSLLYSFGITVRPPLTGGMLCRNYQFAGEGF